MLNSSNPLDFHLLDVSVQNSHCVQNSQVILVTQMSSIQVGCLRVAQGEFVNLILNIFQETEPGF